MSTQPEYQPLEATDATFEKVVVERSREVPVLVDFWAPWCAPCRQLGPVLEQLAAESNGKFELVKINLDENPMLAQALTIRSIPAVKLIVNGEIKDEFLGAYPEKEVRAFLEKNLPYPTDDTAITALMRMMAGDAGAAPVLQDILRGDPDNPVALIGWGLHHAQQGDVEQARGALMRVSETELDRLVEKALVNRSLASLKGRVFLMEQAADGSPPPESGEAGSNSLQARLAEGCRLALAGEHQRALEEFLEIVRKNRAFGGDAGRKGMLAVFDLLPEKSPLLPAYRNKLSAILFS